MANVVKLKRGSGSDPSASDMVVGEPVIRTDTAELFFEDYENRRNGEGDELVVLNRPVHYHYYYKQ